MRSLPVTAGYGGTEGIKTRSLEFASSAGVFSPCNSLVPRSRAFVPSARFNESTLSASWWSAPFTFFEIHLCNDRRSGGAREDHNGIPDTNVFRNFQSNHFTGVRVRGGEHLTDAEFNRSAIR
jgi:hypothetical protein